MKKKTAIKAKARKTRTPAKRLAAKRKPSPAADVPKRDKMIVQKISDNITLRRTPHEAYGRGGRGASFNHGK